MAEREIVVEADADGICDRAAMIWQQMSDYLISERGVFRVALSGGSTPRRLYELLASATYREHIRWDRIQFFFGDERAVGPDDADSNYRMARESLFGPLGLADEQVFRMRGEAEDLDAAAHEYEQNMRTSFAEVNSSGLVSFDLMLLGMGPDGHTASLFPHTGALQERSRWVVVNEVPQLETRRMTMTFPIINAARQIMFLVGGESKAGALGEVLAGRPDSQTYPSQSVAPTRGKVMFIIDDAAAANLPKGEVDSNE